MPPPANALTDVAARSAKSRDKAYKIVDGQGMYLEVMPNGSKYWRLKYRIDGKKKRAALGVYPAVSLLAARKPREEIKAALRAGLDPASQKKEQAGKRIAEHEKANPRTVADAMKEYRSKVSPKKEGCRAEQLRLERSSAIFLIWPHCHFRTSIHRILPSGVMRDSTGTRDPTAQRRGRSRVRL